MRDRRTISIGEAAGRIVRRIEDKLQAEGIMTTLPIEIRAKAVQKFINDTIRDVCTGESPLLWQTLAEEVVDKHCDKQEWGFMMLDEFGKPPTFIITRALNANPMPQESPVSI